MNAVVSIRIDGADRLEALITRHKKLVFELERNLDEIHRCCMTLEASINRPEPEAPAGL